MGFFEDRTFRLTHSKTLVRPPGSEFSGCTYASEFDRIYIISDNPAEGIQIVNRSGLPDGNIVLPSPPFDDTEAITYMGNGSFSVLSEGRTGPPFVSAKLHNFTVFQEDRLVVASDVTTYDLTGVDLFSGGLGAEGLAYDTQTGLHYVMVQHTAANGGGLWEIDTTRAWIRPKLLWRNYDKLVLTGHVAAGDSISDIEWGGRRGFPNSLFLLTRQATGGTQKVLHVSYDGTVMSSFDHGLSGQVEGLTFDTRNGDMFLVREGSSSANFFRYSTRKLLVDDALSVRVPTASLNHAGSDFRNPVVSGFPVVLTLHKHGAENTLKKAWVTVGGQGGYGKDIRDITHLGVETDEEITFSLTAGVELESNRSGRLNVIHVATAPNGYVNAAVYVESRPPVEITLDGYDASDYRVPLVLPKYVDDS